MIRVTEYGLSMYGGYYANFNIEGKHQEIISRDGVRFDKLKDLRAWAKERGIELKKVHRFDN